MSPHCVIAFGLLIALLLPVSAQAAPCREAADEIVRTATVELLQDAVKKTPELGKLDEDTLVLKSGELLLESPRGDFKARGWMMLLWFGGKQGQEMVANSAETLETEEARAHLFFVMGLWKLRAPSAKFAQEGRSLMSQVRDTGKVTFVPDEMWEIFLETCELPK